jgi:hypothetical protein
LSCDLVDGMNERGVFVRPWGGLGRDRGLGEAGAEVAFEFIDLLAGFVAAAAEVSEAGGRGGDEFADGVDVLAFEDVLSAGGKVEREYGSLGRGGVDGEGAGRGIGHVRIGEAGFGKRSVPSCAHFGGRIEALGEETAKCAGEKGGEGLADLGIEKIGGDSDLVRDEMGCTLAVTPAGESAGGHFIEDDGGGEPFGMGIPTGA